MAPVVLVGAGPTGLLLACELRLAGVETVLLEQLAEPTGQSRALALHARSAELLDQRGLLEPFIADGDTWPYGHYAGFRLDMNRLDGRHRYTLHIPQSRVEHLLERAATERGADIRRGHQIAGLSQDADGVEVTVRADDGEYRLRCSYLVGCDGAHSTVRKLAGIDFPGTPSTLWGVLGDVTSFDAPVSIREPIITPEGWFAVAPLGDGLTRLMCVQDGRPVRDDTDDTDDTTAELLRAMIRRILGVDVELGEPRWLSRFGDATRLAERYRVGRVFLAGDAAHIHFPLAAQGMNTGLQDAANLGWKLAAAVQGWAPPGLLDTYHIERHAVGEQVCANSRAQITFSFPADRAAPLRDLLARLLEFDEVHDHLARRMSGVDTHYRLACPDGEADDGPVVGRRLPDAVLSTPDGEITVLSTLRHGRGVLLDLTAGADLTAARGWTGRVDVIRADPVPELPRAALLLRPDGHVAWRGEGGDGRLADALRAWFGSPTTVSADGEKDMTGSVSA